MTWVAGLRLTDFQAAVHLVPERLRGVDRADVAQQSADRKDLRKHDAVPQIGRIPLASIKSKGAQHSANGIVCH